MVAGVPTPKLVVAGGISIGGDSNAVDSTSHVVTVADGTSVSLLVSALNTPEYSMDISNVYDTDKEIYIMINPLITNANNPAYKEPHPMFFYFEDPCSFKVDYYNASNQTGTISWYLDNVELSTDNVKGSFTLCQIGLNQLKVRGDASIITYVNDNPACPSVTTLWCKQWANTEDANNQLTGFQLGAGETGNTDPGEITSLAEYLKEDLESNINTVEYRPGIELDISSPVDQVESSCCYTKDETVTITPTLNITTGVLEDYVVTWSLEDPEGLLTSYTTPDLTFDLTKLGTYSAEITVTHTACGSVFTKTTDVNTCNFITFEYEDCNEYVMYNKSFDTQVDYTIRSIDDTFSLTGTLNGGLSQPLVFTTPSIYIITISQANELDQEYVIHNYCEIENCLGDYILGLICGTSCGDCPSDVELNRFILLYHTYFLELNREYGTNNFYNGLSESKLAKLTDMKTVLDKILEFCSLRNCKSFTNPVNIKSNDCGC